MELFQDEVLLNASHSFVTKSPQPHTKLAAAETAVLQEFHFCNCRRRDDPGGQWLIARLSQQVDILDVLRNAILFAVIPKPSTFAYSPAILCVLILARPCKQRVPSQVFGRTGHTYLLPAGAS